jgi:membrane fusion protein (multidrug efflux system)
MKRFLISTLIAAAAIAGTACTKKSDAAPPPSAGKEAPALPADVQNVAAASGAPAASPVTNAAEAGGAPQVAAESGGAIIATGEFVSPVRSELSAKNPGRVAKMFVDEGSRVSRGQPLLEIESDYTRLNLQRAEADAQRAAAAEREAERDLARKKELIGKESIPQATFDRSQGTYEQARAAKASALAQAAIYRQQIGDAVLRSPIDGVVAEKRTDVGQRLGEATVALVVVQTSPLKLRFRVPEKYLAQVHRGQSVKATTDAYPGAPFEGKVTVVGGVIDTATRSFTVETEFANRDGRLRPGMFARVEMEPR